MTSKNLFFNMMKENFKQRLWSVALIALVFFFTFPVSTALRLSNSSRWMDAQPIAENAAELFRLETINYFTQLCSVSNGFIIFLLILFAVVNGISGFAYLHSKKKTDFYHSIPISREKLFAVVSLNGILFVAIPYLVGILLSAIMIQVKFPLGAAFGTALMGYLFHMALYFLVYSSVVAAVILTGNTIVSVLGTLVFFLWGPSVTMLIMSYFSHYFMTFYSDDIMFSEVWNSFSPIAWYIRAAISDHPGSMALWGAAAGAVITAVVLLLYRVRPSEAAGRAMAFRKSQPVIKFLIVVPCALLGSLLFHDLMASDGWSVFGLVCGLIISYAIVEIIYNFDLKRLFANKLQLLICGGVAAIVVGVFRFDLCGYDSYLPSESKVVSSGIYVDVLDSDAIRQYQSEPELKGTNYVEWSRPTSGDIAKNMQILDQEDIYAVARQGIEDMESTRSLRLSGDFWSSNPSGTDESFGSIVVAYRLKNGRTVTRSYYLYLSKVKESLDRIYETDEYKDGIYPILNQQAEEIAGINVQEGRELFRQVDLRNDDMKQKILAAYQKELRALTVDVRRQESPIAAIQFKTNEMQEMINILRENRRDFTTFNYERYYPIYPSFTETIALLKECGIDVGGLLTADTVTRIELTYERDWDDDDVYEEEPYTEELQTMSRSNFQTVRLTEREQISQVLESVSQELNVDNNLNPQYRGIYITAYVPIVSDSGTRTEDEEPDLDTSMEEEIVQDNFETYELYFDYDKVPDFVIEQFALTEERMNRYKTSAY